ncbi:MAG: ABC transporter permease [Actinomycetes bacterium]
MIEKLRSYGIVGVFGLLFVVLAISSPSFLSWQNAANILDQSSILFIMATVLTLCIIAGIFDLSVAATATASAIMTVNAINALGMVLGIIVGVGFGGVLGLLNGLGIVGTNVNSFIGTLATSFAFRGLGLILCSGGLVSITNKDTAIAMRSAFEGKFLGIKGAIYIALIFSAIVGIFLSRTIWGRNVYAVGGNAQAAFLAGIRTNRILISCYVISGIGAGLAGMIYAGRYGSGATNAYSDTIAFTAIAAPVVGGVSVFGGSGSIWRGILGILTFALIGNGLNLLGVDTTYQLTALGLLIFAAVAADQVFRRSRG